MNTYSKISVFSGLHLCVLLVFILFSGCISRLLLLGEAELVAVRSASRISGLRAPGTLARASRMGILIEDLEMITSSATRIRAGRIIPADEIAFNSSIERIRLVRGIGTNHQLYIKGASEPFAEVLSSTRQIRLFNNQIFNIYDHVYAVGRNGVNVRMGPNINSGKIIHKLKEGDLVIKLMEDKGWYQVRFVNKGQEYIGYIFSSLLIPLAFYDEDERTERNLNSTPSDLINEEADNRWKYYFSKIGGRQVDRMSSQDAMDLLYDSFRGYTFERKISYKVNDWPRDINEFVVIKMENIPILNERDFKSQTLKIIGFTKSDEILQFIEQQEEWVKLMNPVDMRPDNFGIWYYIKTLDNKYGWILVQPYGDKSIRAVKIRRH